MRKWLKKCYLALILLFMYAPLAILVVLSFNQSKTRSKWGGFTWKWYVSLFQNDSIMNALYTTLTIALLSALIATLLGALASIGIQSLRSRPRSLMMTITNIPMLNADIVTGISLMLLFIACRFSLGYMTVLAAHITFNIPYVILSVLPKLRQTSRSTYEAALDLGASPLQSFCKVILPDILPGIVSGFILAFTMSLDDFVITHFTKGPGVDTLSTKIYSEVRKGIKPEMYALSTLLFVTILLLLILINLPSDEKTVSTVTAAGLSSAPDSRKRIPRHSKRYWFRMVFSRILPICIILTIAGGGVYYSTSNRTSSTDQLIVYNWGEYIDPDVITQFEDETGINVIYEEFDTNETMYPKIQSGAIAYDVVCPSDYMIQRMIENDLLAPLHFKNIPNASNIGDTYWDISAQFDPDNLYSVPYCWGTVGILYNTKLVTEPVDSWSILWDDQYQNNILMQNSVRDAFGITLKYLGYSLNSTDLDELTEAQDLLIEQKPLVQAYVIDQVRDKMISEEASLGVIYSGEALYTQEQNANLAYVIPKEGSNVWVDSWVIPKNAKHQSNAEKWIDFMCRADIAKKNFDYIRYSTPNEAAKALLPPAEQNSNILFPSDAQLANCEVFRYLGDENNDVYNELWQEVKSR